MVERTDNPAARRTRIAKWSVPLAGVVLLLLGVSPVPAAATFPGVNGRIAFYRADDNGFAQLWTANPDLTAAHQLTSGNADSGWPVWSPDGSRIAFDSDRTDPDLNDSTVINDVFTMGADGTDVQKVTDSVGFSGDAAYSPDGSLIAFDANRGVTSGDPGWPSATADLSIYVINPAGTGLRRVTTPPAGSSDTEPRFSPDGTQLVFTRFQGGHFFQSGRQDGRVVGDTSAIFTVHLDGTNVHRITGWGLKTGQADWSPDGSRIVFEQACCRLGTSGVFTVPSTGGAITTVVNATGVTGIGNATAFRLDGYYDPVWSPDGTKILSGHETIDNTGTYRSGLVLLNADGTDLHWVSPDVDGEHQPDWSSAPLQ
jgi:Tol biopolymer transport system component